MLGALQSPQPPPTESILTALLNDIATVPDNFVLVLDDYHVIDARAVDDALTFLLEHLPPQMHLVIATREDPHLPLARLRARGQLTELRAADLRFTPSEAAEFLNQVMGLNLSAEDIAALETRTEGWIAGLQLAALSMQGHEDATGFIKSFTGSHRFVLDYLVEEVLQQQPEHVQTFLLRTSILDRLCGPLCDAVLLDPCGSRARNAGISRTRQPVSRSAGRRAALVPLSPSLCRFAAAATAPERSDRGRGRIARRASQWYEDNGLETEAIHHALVAEDFERAAGLVEMAWPAMDGRFQAAAWLGWVKALPDELVRARPVLSVGYAWALLGGGELEAGEARLLDAERWLEASADSGERPEDTSSGMVVVDEEQFRFLPASIASARAYHALAFGDVPGTAEYARRALDLLPREDHTRRGQAAALLGLAYWTSGDLEAAHQALADAMANFRMAGNLHFAISGTYGLADIRIDQGRLRDAVRTYENALQLAMEQGEPALRGTAELYLGLSGLYLERGDLEAARQHLLKSEELGEHAALPNWPYRRCVAAARMAEAQGEFDDALDLLDEAQRLYHRTPVPDVRPVAAIEDAGVGRPG